MGRRACARCATCADARCPTPHADHPGPAPGGGGDRLDLVAARYLGDPTAAWQVADANGALDPDELTAVEAEGDLLVVPFPGGVP